MLYGEHRVLRGIRCHGHGILNKVVLFLFPFLSMGQLRSTPSKLSAINVDGKNIMSEKTHKTHRGTDIDKVGLNDEGMQ